MKVGIIADFIKPFDATDDEFDANKVSQLKVIVNVMCGFNITFGILLGPSIALNSHLFNKQIQNIRYPYMLSLSEFGFPQLLGAKMNTPCRRIENEISRLYLQLCSANALCFVESNIKEWKASQLRPKTSIPSLSIAGSKLLSDRQFVFEIYLVHVYNKEIDDFDTGQIKVFSEYAQRHVDWEEDLQKSLETLKKSNMDKTVPIRKRQKALRRIRLLLGVPKLDTLKNKQNGLELLKTSLEGNTKKRILNVSDVNSSHSADSDESSSATYLSVGSKPNADTSPFRTRSSSSYTINLGKGLAVTRSELTRDQEVVKPLNLELTYTPNISDVKQDILEVIKHNPKYSYASYEMCQLAAETSKDIYNEGVIEKARRSDRNWKPITQVIESTSIISKVKSLINLSDTVENIIRNTSKKMMKLMKQRLDHSKDAINVEQKEALLNYFKESMLDLDSGWTPIVNKVIESVKDSNRLDYVSWEHQVKLPIQETLLTNDANQAYYWVKSMSREIKRIKKVRELGDRFKCKTDELTSIRNKLSSRKFSEGNAITRKELDVVYNSWLSATKLFIKEKGVTLPSEEVMKVLTSDMKEMYENYESLKLQKEKFEAANYQLEEAALADLELNFINKYGKDLSQFFNIMLIHTLMSPWTDLLDSIELQLLYMGKNFQPEETKDEEGIGIVDIIAGLLDFTIGVETIFCVSRETTIQIIKYVITMFRAANLPFKHIYDSANENTSHRNTYSILLERAKDLLARMTLEDQGYDFFLTVLTIRAKSFLCMKRLLGRGGNDRLPRSTRSKVLYELVKTTQETKQSILQQQAFGAILNKEHRNFATLAPKGQLGDIRDLLVQEIYTKLINATSELFAKSMLDNVTTDALVNPKLKDKLLENANNQKKTAYHRHGRPYGNLKDQDNDRVHIYIVYTISGDHGKWGPVHSCATFNAIDQQLLKDCPDWKSFMMLVNFKSLIKLIEIPVPSIQKVFNSLLASDDFLSLSGKRVSEEEIQSMLIKLAEKWGWTSYMGKIIKWYLAHSKMALNSYNHMGQGIHHAKSSEHGDVIRRFITKMIKEFFKIILPTVTVDIEFVGSSDDFGIIVRFTGITNKNDLKNMEFKIKDAMRVGLNIFSALSRVMQMYWSEKTVISSTVTEMYSDFDMFNRMSPSVMKFIVSTIINSTITTPLTLYRSMHVCAQQAAMMSTPFLTNLCFCLCRQQSVLNHVEAFIRNFGKFMFKLPSSFGRLYIPFISTLLTNTLELEDMSVVLQSAVVMKKYLANVELLNVEDPIGVGSIEDLQDVSDNITEKVKSMSNIANINDEFIKEAPVATDYYNRIPIVKVLFPSLSSAMEIPFDQSTISSVESFMVGSHSGDSLSNDSDVDIVSQYRIQGSDKENSDNLSSLEDGKIYKEIGGGFDQILSAKPLDRELNEAQLLNLGKILDSSSEKAINTDMTDTVVSSLIMSTHIHQTMDPMLYELVNMLSNTKEVKEFCLSTDKIYESNRHNVAFKILMSNAILTITSYYDSFKTEGIERVMKGEALYNCSTLFEDPFLYLMPDSVKGCLNRLNLLKGEVGSSYDDLDALNDNASFLSRTLIESNNATEDFGSEMKRIRQIVTSRNIINKLSGGMKEHSLPFIRMEFNSFFFNNKIPMYLRGHWSKTRDSSVRSNNNKIVEGEKKVRFKDWIKELFTFVPVRMSEVNGLLFKFDFLLEPKVNSIAYVDISGDKSLSGMTLNLPSTKVSTEQPNLRKLSLFNVSNLNLLIDQLAVMITRRTPFNKIRLNEAEESGTGLQTPAQSVIVAKTKLFSRESVLRLDNNPAVVIGFILDPITAESTRPIGLRLGSLETDKQALMAYNPMLSVLIKKVKSNDIKDPTEIMKCKSVLLNFCRSMTSESMSTTPFYAFRPHTANYEDSSVSIISYGTIEGIEVTIDEKKVFSATFSEKYFRIMECIALLSSLPISDDKKTKLLTRLLMWNPGDTTNKVMGTHDLIECKDSAIEQEALGTLSTESLAVQLMSEARAVRSNQVRESIVNIANFVLNPNDIGKDNRRTDLKLTFKTEGTPNIDGRFQLSCEFGAAIGIYMDNSLVITMSLESTQLLEILENELSRWVFGIKSSISNREGHIRFISLLPTYRESSKFVPFSEAKQVVHFIDRGISRLQFSRVREESRVVYIKGDLITTRSYAPERRDRNPKIKWSRGRMTIYLTDETAEVKINTYMPIVMNILTIMNQPTILLEKATLMKEQEVKVCSIDLPKTISQTSLYIMHRFMYHQVQLSSAIHSNTKTLFLSAGFDGLPDAQRIKVINDQTLDVIRAYALNKTEEAKAYEMKLKERVLSKYEKRITFKGVIYGKDEAGTFRTTEDGIIYIGSEEPNYLEVNNLLELHEQDDDAEDLKLPETMPLELIREFSKLLARRDEDLRRIELNKLINKHFKDVTAWPYVEFLLGELGMDNISARPKKGLVNDSIQWILTEIIDSKSQKAPRDILDAIDQLKSGQATLGFGLCAVTQPVLSIFINKLMHIHKQINLLPIDKRHIKLCMSMMIYLKIFSIDKNYLSYDWIEMLSQSLPLLVHNPRGKGSISFRIIAGTIVGQFNLNVTFEESKLLDNKVKEAETTYSLNQTKQKEELDKKVRKGIVKTTSKYYNLLLDKILVPFNNDKKRGELLRELILSNIFFGNYKKISDISFSVLKTNVPDGFKYIALLDDELIQKNVGAVKFISSLLDISDSKTNLCLGVCLKIFETIFGYIVPEDMEIFIDELKIFDEKQRNSEIQQTKNRQKLVMPTELQQREEAELEAKAIFDDNDEPQEILSLEKLMEALSKDLEDNTIATVDSETSESEDDDAYGENILNMTIDDASHIQF